MRTAVSIWVGRGKSGHGKTHVPKGRAKLGSRRQAQTGGDLKKILPLSTPNIFPDWVCEVVRDLRVSRWLPPPCPVMPGPLAPAVI